MAYMKRPMLLANLSASSKDVNGFARRQPTVFLGVPRDTSVAPPQEVSRWMLAPTLAHAAGVVVLGAATALAAGEDLTFDYTRPIGP